ncbi:MAG TPA: acyloxyacyl hydrolase [Terriglobales bacterium]|nr:acyloxyacyl hydrolase [Terriglobales bacterium]
MAAVRECHRWLPLLHRTGAGHRLFAFSFDGGVEIFQGRHSFVLGYRHHHISNGYTATYNPGIDSQMISVGFSFKR